MIIIVDRAWLLAPLLTVASLLSSTALAQNAKPLALKLSAGTTWQARNNVQIPNDLAGTRFSLDDVTGTGPYAGVRLEGIWTLRERHQLRVLLAPLSLSETGNSDVPVTFAGTDFDDNEPLEASYRFNSWRIGYRYHVRERQNWDLWLGGTLKVRDAEIKLQQAGSVAKDDDVGIVPLLYVAGEYRLTERWSVSVDLDGLAGGPGRAIDLGIGVNYAINQAWRVGLEYRTLEGGADTDDVYNFAWFNSALLTLEYQP